MGEFLTSLRDEALRRLQSPLVNAIVISWCIWNYDFFVILFGVADVATKLQLLDERFAFTTQDWFLRLIGGPVVSALAYLAVMPALNGLTSWWLIIVSNWVVAKQMHAKKQIPVPPEVLEQREREISEILEQYRQEAASRDAQIQRLLKESRDHASTADDAKANLRRRDEELAQQALKLASAQTELDRLSQEVNSLKDRKSQNTSGNRDASQEPRLRPDPDSAPRGLGVLGQKFVASPLEWMEEVRQLEEVFSRGPSSSTAILRPDRQLSSTESLEPAVSDGRASPQALRDVSGGDS